MLFGDMDNLFVNLNTGVLWRRGTPGWWNTGINVHATGPVRYEIPSSDIFVPLGQVPDANSLGLPIGPEIPDGSTASGGDGRVWTWLMAAQRFFLSTDITPRTNIPSSMPDWIINRPPTGCGRIIPVTRYPPNPLPDTLEGIEGETTPAYDIAVSDDGTIADFINGKWTARGIRWKTISQAGDVIFRKDTPEEWTWFDSDPTEPDRSKPYSDRWRVVVSMSLGNDSTGSGYYGQMYIRNFRTQSWEKYYTLCDPNIPIPAAPRSLAVGTTDVEQRIRIVLSWAAPQSRLAPQNYRYRLFEKTRFDNDGSIVTLMAGTTTLLSVAELHVVDPPTRYYLEVRAEYVDGNSKWVRIETLVGLSCAEDPAPLAPSLSFTGISQTSGTFNGVPGITTSSTLGRITYNWGYPGSGTRPAYWAWEAGPINFNAYIQPSEAGGERGSIQLTDPDGNAYTVYPDRWPGHTNPTSLRQSEGFGGISAREMPGLVGLMSGRMISRCGSVFRWGQRAILDIMRAQSLTPFGTPFNQNLRVENLANVTPQGTAAGTFHFQYRAAGTSPSSADVTAVQILIRGWHMDEYGRPDVSDSISVYGGTRFFNATVRADTPSGTRARNIAGVFPIHSGSGAKEIRLTTGSSSTDRILVVSGMPTDFDGFYSISMRLRDAASTSVSLAQSTYGNWTSIRFQQIGTRRPPPPPTVGIPLNVRGNESPQSSLTWEFAWAPPLFDASRNVLPAIGYMWDVSGQTVHSGLSLLERLSVPNLNTGTHTLTLRAVNGQVIGAPVTYPFFVRDGPPICSVRAPINGRQIPSGVTGLTLVQFDAPNIGTRPTLYQWALTAVGPAPGGTVTPTIPSGGETGSASPTTVGGTIRLSSLPEGTYSLAISAQGCIPVRTSAENLSVTVIVSGRTPDQPFPPRNLRTQEGASRTTFESEWDPPQAGPRPDAYEYKIDGQTTQSAASTVETNAIHVSLNPGVHTLSVRSTKTGATPSTWATKSFTVRAEGCNPVESLEESVGGTRDAPIWNARKIFWAEPIGGMPATGYTWELFDSGGGRLQHGSTTASVRRVDLFELAEGTYSISVRAVCADGPSDSKEIGFTAVCPPPEPPEQPAVVVSGLSTDQVASATWSAPTTGGSPTGYIWQLVGPEVRGDTVAPSVVSVVLEDLPDGEYQFRIRSTGDCDKESTNQIVHFEIGGTTTCQSPRLLRKEEGAIWSTWTVLWLAPGYGDTPLRYDWRLDGPTQVTGTVTPNPADNLSGQATVDNLQPGQYRFFVKTICDLNPTPPASGESKESSITIKVTRRAPGNPRNVSVESVTSALVTDENSCPPVPSWVGTWDPPSGGTVPSNYDWELYNSDNARILESTVPSITRRAVLGRLASGSYRFQVRSKSGTQTSGWEGYGFTVPVEDLNPPVDIGVTHTGIVGQPITQYSLNWSPNPCGLQPDGYTWRWREKGTTSDLNAPVKSSTTTATLTGGTNGTTYVVYVKAHKGSRESSEASREFVWGAESAINPPTSLDSRRLNPPVGSNVRFIWGEPAGGLEPARFNWTLTGPGATQSGSEIRLRKQFNDLEPGLYAFSVRSDVRSSVTDTAITGTNVSTWETIGYTVIGDNDAPGAITIESVAATLRTPQWKGGQSFTHTAVWDASPDKSVDGYDWIGTWSHAGVASSGSTGKDTADRRIPLGDIPVGNYTITVWSTKSGERRGSRIKDFEIVQRSLEPPSDLGVDTEGDEDSGWEHTVTFDEPTTGRLVSGFQYRLENLDEGDEGTWENTFETEFELSSLVDAEYRLHLRSFDADGNSDSVSRGIRTAPRQT